MISALFINSGSRIKAHGLVWGYSAETTRVIIIFAIYMTAQTAMSNLKKLAQVDYPMVDQICVTGSQQGLNSLEHIRK